VPKARVAGGKIAAPRVTRLRPLAASRPAVAPAAARRAADVLVDILAEAGVEIVFGLPGGVISPIHDALLGRDILCVTTRHESGAMFAAAGMRTPPASSAWSPSPRPGDLAAHAELLRHHPGPVVVDVRIDPLIRLPRKDRVGAFSPKRQAT
jgi:hypothetical protein